MPWINKEMCTGCQTCINECTVGAISMEADAAVIKQDECIRCGVCHDVCPVDAIRHDGEKVAEEVQANLTWAKKFLTHDYYLNDTKKQKELLGRLQRFFTKNIKVAEKTIEKLKSMQDAKAED